MTDQTKVDTTVLKKTTVAFFTAEFNEIHALCDAAEIPRKTRDGEVFTAAQRVRILFMATEGTRAAIRKARGDVTH